MPVFPVEVKRGHALPSCFSSYTISKDTVHGLFNAIFFIVDVFFFCWGFKFFFFFLLFRAVLTAHGSCQVGAELEL